MTILFNAGGNYGDARQTQYQETQTEHSEEERGKEASGEEIRKVK